MKIGIIASRYNVARDWMRYNQIKPEDCIFLPYNPLKGIFLDRLVLTCNWSIAPNLEEALATGRQGLRPGVTEERLPCSENCTPISYL